MQYQLINARLFGKSKNDFFDIAISDGRITSIYPAGVSRNQYRKLDTHGGWVAPSFIDAHVHLTNTGVKLSGLDLSVCNSYEELKTATESIPNNGDIVIGHGWDDSKWSKKADSEVFRNDSPPIYLSRIDAHSALVSPALISQVPQVFNADGFSQTNPLTSDAHGIVREFAYGSMTSAQRQFCIEKAIFAFFANGVTQVHEMAGPRISSYEDAELVSAVASKTGMQLQLWWGELNGHEKAKSLLATGCGGDLFIDGSLGSKTALIREPYISGGNGNQYISADEAAVHIISGYDFDLPTSFHAIGDRAIEIASEAFSIAKTKLGPKQFARLSHRIEHAEFLNSNLIKRLVDLGITFSMQPQFSKNWAGDEGMYSMRIGKRWESLNPFRPLLEQGARIIFGSDSPVTQINPWLTISASMSMHKEDYSITQKSAFRSHATSNIEIGGRANLAVWDVEKWSQIQIDDVKHRWSTDARSFPNDYPDPTSYQKCLLTVSNGRIVYSDIGMPLD